MNRHILSRLMRLGALMTMVSLATACGDELGPTAPSSAPVAAPATAATMVASTVPRDNLLDLTGLNLSKLLRLLSCQIETFKPTSKVIGPAGGALQLGAHTLVIPPGALLRPVEISGRSPLGGLLVGVEFQPQGLIFAKPSTLTLDYTGCVLPPLSLLGVVYIDPLHRVLEREPSTDDRVHHRISASIRHFSSYAIAY